MSVSSVIPSHGDSISSKKFTFNGRKVEILYIASYINVGLWTEAYFCFVDKPGDILSAPLKNLKIYVDPEYEASSQ